LSLKTESTVQKGIGKRDGKEGPMEIRQTALVATLHGRTAMATLIFPRLKTDPVPTVTWFADGEGVKLDTPSGTDYLFLATLHREDEKKLPPNKGLSTAGHDAAFQCTSGAVQLRSKRVTLTLGTPGRIQFGEHILADTKPAARTDPR
ncbi:MAG TPA: hypothetical protein PLR25_29845, partial [Planctomycetaceae bacterium]|nr:hypothetical protein [Planctomycetaceae bacterium]